MLSVTDDIYFTKTTPRHKDVLLPICYTKYIYYTITDSQARLNKVSDPVCATEMFSILVTVLTLTL